MSVVREGKLLAGLLPSHRSAAPPEARAPVDGISSSAWLLHLLLCGGRTLSGVRGFISTETFGAATFAAED